MVSSETDPQWVKLLVYTTGDLRAAYERLKASLEVQAGKGGVDQYYCTFHRREGEARLSLGLKLPSPLPDGLRTTLGSATSWAETHQALIDLGLDQVAAELSSLRDEGLLSPVGARLGKPDPVQFEELKALATQCRNWIESRLGPVESLPADEIAQLVHFLCNPTGYAVELRACGSLISGISSELLRRELVKPLSETSPTDLNSFLSTAATNADALAAEFNRAYPEFGIAAAIYGLSLNLAPMMDNRYPRLLASSRRNLPGEQEYRPSVEAIVWAINMIASAWEGWLHQSKALGHYGEAQPIELEILQDVVIPSTKDKAFSAGVERAKREKSPSAD